MFNKEKITTIQMGAMCWLLIMGDMLFVYPSSITSYAKESSLICAIAGIPLGVLLMLVFLKIHKASANNGFIQFCIKMLGTGMGTGMVCIYLFYFAISASSLIRNVADFVNTQLYPYTPLQIIMLIFTLTTVCSLIQGVEVLGRVSEIMAPIVLVFIIFFLLCLIPKMEINNSLPLFSLELKSLAQGSVLSFVYPIGEIIPILLILPFVNSQKHTNRDLLIVTGFGSFILSMIVMTSLLVAGPFLTQHNFYTTFFLAQKISIGKILERIEALIACAWIIATYIKTVAYMYAFINGLSELFKLKHHRTLILPSSLLIFGLAGFVVPDQLFNTWFAPYWLEFECTICVVVPLFLILIYQLKQSNM